MRTGIERLKHISDEMTAFLIINQGAPFEILSTLTEVIDAWTTLGGGLTKKQRRELSFQEELLNRVIDILDVNTNLETPSTRKARIERLVNLLNSIPLGDDDE